MLKLDPSPTFVADVNLTVPGQKKPEVASMTFKYKTRQEFSEFLNGLEGRKLADVVCEIVESWDQMPLEFSKENVEKIMEKYIPFGNDILNTYIIALSESRVKN